MPAVITVSTMVYEFWELSDEAKAKARDWFRTDYPDHEWWDFVYEDAKTIGTLMGIEIKDIFFSGFSSQGDGAQFTGGYKYAKNSRAAVREHAPEDKVLHLIVDELYNIQAANFYGLSVTIRATGGGSHEFCTSINAYHTRSEQEYPAHEDDEIVLAGELRDFMRWIYKCLEAEYDCMMSDEAISETILANEYTFIESGVRFA